MPTHKRILPTTFRIKYCNAVLFFSLVNEITSHSSFLFRIALYRIPFLLHSSCLFSLIKNPTSRFTIFFSIVTITSVSFRYTRKYSLPCETKRIEKVPWKKRKEMLIHKNDNCFTVRDTDNIGVYNFILLLFQVVRFFLFFFVFLFILILESVCSLEALQELISIYFSE